jgi:ribonucleoside-diphosphate reductase alpha chain
MSKITHIRKRDGRIVEFKQQKITDAIYKAFIAVREKDGKLSKKVSDAAVKTLEKRFMGKIPSVENIQDIVIEVLKSKGYHDVTEEYSAYRKKKIEIRKLQQEFGIEEKPKLTVNALQVLKKRYLLRNEAGEIIETPAQMFRRVAKAVSQPDKLYGENPEISEEKFYKVMSSLEFLPNSPTMFNAGAPLGQLSACFVLPIEDSLDSIFTAVKNMALIEQSGGGVGFDFSKLRPKGDIVKSTKGIASGPVSFMRVFDTATDVIKAGGKRRGAMMAILRVDHPDILEFITVKSKEKSLTNFNLSVAITDDFMKAVEENKEYDLINPRTNVSVKRLKARQVWDTIIENAWSSGDPGVVFIDEINRFNPTPEIGRIESTNPCGEQPLLPYESCNLGSINLTRMLNENNEIDWDKLKKTVHLAVHFLDNVIDANKFPLKEIETMTKANRKIGLGIMGFAEMLIIMGIPYDSQGTVDIAEKIMKFVTEEARKKSAELGEKRVSFSNFEKSVWHGKYNAMRNATVATIAPTGTISIIAGCSSGIEPLFAVSFMRNVLEGTKLFEVNPIFEKIAKEKNFYSGPILERIARNGSLQKIKEIPKDVRRIFVTALDIKPEWHIKMQAAFQKWTDNSVSKTINLPNKATIKDVERIYKMAWKLKCKGITVYRYGCKPEQVLYIGEIKKKTKYVQADEEYSGGCVTKSCPFPS